MEKSFRDILSQFLEEKVESKADSPSENSTSATPNAPFHEPLWQVQFQQKPLGKAASKYKSPSVERVEPASIKETVTPPPPPVAVVEELIPLEKLDRDSRIMVGIIMDLGAAAELKNGVSLHRIKKSYRRLVKKYHPDRNGGQSSDKFFRLQKAYDFLCESLNEDLQEAA